ncbi:DNA-binding protein [Pseudomonas sp. PS01301]|uniref:DNA-binding protein n=1 Tax=Pseudomonas sp. PS01301 TaxID=2991437 RepID=UPI00249CCAF9|nr:DNA-binding protein [Pseudomonas sp. PS01301]
MPQSKILTDTNSYLRLAHSIRPLLCIEFGDKNYCLYVLPETNSEIQKSSRLKTKFFWALEKEHCDERSQTVTVSRQQRKLIADAYSFIWDHVESELPGPSRVDAIYLAHSYVLGLPVVTDDRDMHLLAQAFDIKTQKTLDLLKLMVDSAHITLNSVTALVQYWHYNKDTPADFQIDLSRIFENQIPHP